MSATVLVIGCGNMGYALLSGWRAQDPALRLYAVEPVAALRDRAASTGALAASSIDALPAGIAPDLIVLAVKPTGIIPALWECARFAGTATFLSVAAGVRLTAMAAALPNGSAIIRCMPNTPAAIGEGMMALCAAPTAGAQARALAERLMSGSGTTVWIADEAEMDAVTAISGSGPAYVFLFIEALAGAAKALGLPREIAATLALETVAGAAVYARRSNQDPGTLRRQVTSPNGTTAAALDVLMGQDQLAELVAAAASAAYERSLQLGKDI